jgi:hypothetical protein
MRCLPFGSSCEERRALSDPIARTDQAKEEIRNLVPILGTYFNGLLSQGFERTEAMELVRDLQAGMLGIDDDDD